ncbi:hypothetical protein [Streptomyces sp. NPDC059076]|uniref:hypothetical protein n=1 Tax=unclassified Streptomyces TaxID=2593676 RepID=UPI00369FCECE
MAEPYLSFRVPDSPSVPSEHVMRTGERSFRLFAYEGCYPLPIVTLHPDNEPGQAYVSVQLPGRLKLASVDGAELPHGLARALGVAWSAEGDAHRPVIGDLDLVRDAVVEAVFVHLGPRTAGSAARTPDDPLYVDAFWEVDLKSAKGKSVVGASVMLEFAPPGEVPHTVPTTDEPPEFLPLREPSDDHYQEFVVVDFGTTASTVTLQDTGYVERHPIDPDQGRALGRFLTELLTLPQAPTEPGGSEGVPAQWRTAVAEILDGNLTLRGSTEETVTGREAVAMVAEDNPEAVSALQLAVEHALHRGSRELRAWLVPRLHEGYTRVTDTPPLRLHELRPVPFPGPKGVDTFAPASSLVEIVDTVSDTSTGLPESRVFRLSEESGAITGLKRMVMRAKLPEVPDSDLSAIHLTQHLYLELVRTAEKLTADKNNPGSVVQTVVVTYPTTVLPEVKRRLGHLVRAALGAPRVVTDYDEGLAAGLFFVMRELSGNQNLGLEALRARSRRVTRTLPPRPDASDARNDPGQTLPVTPATWHRTMLVIDIGGGTTDIALLKLVLVDQTPERTEKDGRIAGRRYRLEPTLLGSTGHEQLGGDLLTLQVFYWLKAVIVDALRIRGEGEQEAGHSRRSLAAQVSDQAGRNLDQVVDKNVKETLDDYLPTSWNASSPHQTAGGPRDRFRSLWRLAEAKKRALSAADGGLVELEMHELTEVVQGTSKGLAEPQGALALDAGQFRRLMLPVLQRAAEMGADLVRTTFEREQESIAAAAAAGQPTWPEPVLDQVVLSGRTSNMALVRETVIDVLSRADSGSQLKFGWNPTALSIETGFAAKQATSIGAGWAHTVRSVARVTETKRTDEQVSHPRMTDLDIETHGLFSSLPCDLGPRAGAMRPVVLLRAGEPFVELDERGTLGIRSAWNLLPRKVELHRITSASRSIQWGSFDVELAAEGRDAIDLSHPAWHPQRDNGVQYLIEVDQELDPYILFCNGRPHYWVDTTRHHVDLAALINEAVFDPDLGRCRLPGRLCVATVDGGLAEVFPQPPPGAHDDYFTESFHPDADSTQHRLPGRIATISVPPTDGQYEFYLDDGSGNPVLVDSLPVPEAAVHGQQRLHTAALDARGRLSVFRGAVPYASALNLLEVQTQAGLVYRRRMHRGRPEFKDEWDPFNGGH